jgi:hypothetical protein
MSNKVVRWIKSLFNGSAVNPSEHEEHLQEVAYEIAQRFSYDEIAAEDNRIWGWIGKTYPEDWDTDTKVVFDIALFYKKREKFIDVINRVDLTDLKDYTITFLDIEEYTFQNYPYQPFSKVAVLAPKKFSDSVKKIRDRPWWYNGIPTKVLQAKANCSLLTWFSYDIPFVILTHCPGKNELYLDIDLDTNQTLRKALTTLTKLLEISNAKRKTFEDIVEDASYEIQEQANIINVQRKQLHKQKEKNLQEEYEELKKAKEDDDGGWNIKWKYVLYGLAIIGSLSLLGYIASLLLG